MSHGPPPGYNDGRLDRLPPQAVEVEQAVLGAMMYSGEGCEHGLQALSREHFYSAPHGLIFAAIGGLFEKNQNIDQLTLAEELRKRGQLEEVGGVVYLAELASMVSTGANIAYHTQIVEDKGTARFLIETSAAIAERAYEQKVSGAELLDWSEAKICTLAEKKQTTQFETLEEVMHPTFEAIERAHAVDRSVTGVDTGYADLNEITSGWQNGKFIILAARPSVGKTALALCLARHAAQAGTGVAVYSLEMSKQDIAERLLCIETHLDLHRLRAGRLRDEEWTTLTRNVGRLVQLSIHIDDSASLSILEMRAKARQLKRRHGIGMVIVDYLTLMSGDRSGNREQEVSSISRGLKALSKELDVPVLGLSQLSRASESRTDRRPMLSDLRESGSLEQDADVVMFIYRPEMYNIKDAEEGVAEIIIAKQRQGPVGSLKLMWDKTSAQFENLAPEFRFGGNDGRDWERN